MKGLIERLLRYRPRMIHMFIFVIVISALLTFYYNYILIVRAPILKPKFDPWFSEYQKPNWTAMLLEVVNDIRNLPRTPFVVNDSSTENSTCAVFPSVLDLQFSNVYWQVANTSLGTFFMYGAYYDNRSLSFETMEGPVVRILGVLENYSPEPKPKELCHLWFKGRNKPVITSITASNYIWHTYFGIEGPYHAYLYACSIPKAYHHKVPKSVSLVVNPCDNARNALGVQYEKSKKRKGFAVCAKLLNFPYEKDLSPRLIEWIEVNRLLGAEKIFFYTLDPVNPNISKVLKHYERTRFADVTPYTLPGYMPNERRLRFLYYQAPYRRLLEKRRSELVHYNDCLYRNMYKYEYLAVIDIDEILMPLGNVTTWKELINTVKMEHNDFQNITSICFRHVRFYECREKKKPLFVDIPKHMYHLQQVYRSTNHSFSPYTNTKCLHKVEHVLTVHCHYPFACTGAGGGCKNLNLEPIQAQLQHYKPWCGCDAPDCFVIDVALWRFKNLIVERTERVMKTLGFSTEQNIENFFIDY